MKSERRYVSVFPESLYRAVVLALLFLGVTLASPRAAASTFVYVTNFCSVNTVTVSASASNMVVAIIPVGTLPTGVAITPDAAHLYVANAVDNTVSVIDTATNTVVATIAVGTGPTPVAVTPDGTHAYVGNEASNNVSVIDTATNTVVATVAVGLQPVSVAITPDGAHAYVSNIHSS